MTEAGKVRDNETAGVSSRDLFERITEPRPLEWSPMLPLMLPDDLQEAQSAPLALSGDRLHLRTQLVAGARLADPHPRSHTRPLRHADPRDQRSRVCESDACRLLSMFPLRNLDTLAKWRGSCVYQRHSFPTRPLDGLTSLTLLLSVEGTAQLAVPDVRKPNWRQPGCSSTGRTTVGLPRSWPMRTRRMSCPMMKLSTPTSASAGPEMPFPLPGTAVGPDPPGLAGGVAAGPGRGR